MTLKELATLIAQKEGKKSQVRIGDVREILGIMSDLVSLSPQVALDTLNALVSNGKRRAKKKPKK